MGAYLSISSYRRRCSLPGTHALISRPSKNLPLDAKVRHEFRLRCAQVGMTKLGII